MDRLFLVALAVAVASLIGLAVFVIQIMTRPMSGSSSYSALSHEHGLRRRRYTSFQRPRLAGMVFAHPPDAGHFGQFFRSEIVGSAQGRRLILVAQLLFRQKPELVVAVLGLSGLLPKIVGTGPDIFFVGLHGLLFQFKGKIQDATGRVGVANPPCVSTVLLCLNQQVRSLIHENSLPSV
jgi:hypothetical protein